MSAPMNELLKSLRIPQECHIDLTYRCNNDCLHCWLRIPPSASERSRELTFDEIRRIVDEARALGTRRWGISGGEPMLRPDFAEIFDYLTAKSISYTLRLISLNLVTIYQPVIRCDILLP